MIPIALLWGGVVLLVIAASFINCHCPECNHGGNHHES